LFLTAILVAVLLAIGYTATAALTMAVTFGMLNKPVEKVHAYKPLADRAEVLYFSAIFIPQD
jgi:hypothetical protein